MKQKFDFKDVVLVPEALTDIFSRKDVDVFTPEHFLPIMVSPMDTVVNHENYKVFEDSGMMVCLPRGVKVHHTKSRLFMSLSLDEFESFVEDYSVGIFPKGRVSILVDIANGHMRKLYNLVDTFLAHRRVELGHEIMVGNIANPKTYGEYAKLGVDYIRVGIGGGSGGPTSGVSKATRISNTTEAAALIQSIIQDTLGRKATAAELKKYTASLQAAQKKAPTVTKYTSAGTSQTSQTTGGINEQQYLIDKISGTDEAKANKVLGFYETFMNALGGGR